MKIETVCMQYYESHMYQLKRELHALLKKGH